ncbi:MAG: hypothetical protein PHT21_06820 [Lachnospiraceae bacterium]|nr:hypothetical protein [Lachnospiraceae bacterium]
MAKIKKIKKQDGNQAVDKPEIVSMQESNGRLDADMSLKEIERIGLGKRNLTNETRRAERRKKRKKKLLIAAVVITILVITGLFYWYKQIKENESEVESSENIEVGTNQELVLGQITVINGNEMTFVLVEEAENSETASEQTGRGSSQSVSGEIPSGEMPSGEMPSDPLTSTEESVTYTVLDEERTMVIPVGTDVVTKLGTVTTFSRLASGDVLKILTEKSGDEDVILKIWIVG